MRISDWSSDVCSSDLLVLGAQQFGLLELPLIGSFTTFLALVALAVPPLVTNSYVAVAQVPDDLRAAARGMGMTDVDVLRRVELPVAPPLLIRPAERRVGTAGVSTSNSGVCPNI